MFVDVANVRQAKEAVLEGREVFLIVVCVLPVAVVAIQAGVCVNVDVEDGG